MTQININTIEKQLDLTNPNKEKLFFFFIACPQFLLFDMLFIEIMCIQLKSDPLCLCHVCVSGEGMEELNLKQQNQIRPRDKFVAQSPIQWHVGLINRHFIKCKVTVN